MSATTAIIWSLISFGSMWACYVAGTKEERQRWLRRMEKRRRWREWVDEDEE